MDNLQKTLPRNRRLTQKRQEFHPFKNIAYYELVAVTDFSNST